jgi:hypothetical protein
VTLSRTIIIVKTVITVWNNFLSRARHGHDRSPGLAPVGAPGAPGAPFLRPLRQAIVTARFRRAIVGPKIEWHAML